MRRCTRLLGARDWERYSLVPFVDYFCCILQRHSVPHLVSTLLRPPSLRQIVIWEFAFFDGRPLDFEFHLLLSPLRVKLRPDMLSHQRRAAVAKLRQLSQLARSSSAQARNLSVPSAVAGSSVTSARGVATSATGPASWRGYATGAFPCRRGFFVGNQQAHFALVQLRRLL